MNAHSPFVTGLPAALVGVALAFVGFAVAAVLLGRNLDVGQLAHAVLGVVLAAFHRAMDGLVELLVHDEYPPHVVVTRQAGAVTILPG